MKYVVMRDFLRHRKGQIFESRDGAYVEWARRGFVRALDGPGVADKALRRREVGRKWHSATTP